METALITGGSRGIGAAIAAALARAGYAVAINYNHSAEAAEALAASLRAEGRAALPVQADVSDPAQVAAMFAAVERQLGAVSVLVNNAGIAQQKLFTDLSDADWRRMMGVHLDGAFYCCRAALPAMIRARYGRILNIASMWGQVGGSCEVHYSAAKAGLIGLTKALAKEEGPSGITVNCIAPGVVDTDMMASFSAEDRAALADETPVCRLGNADEVAAAAVFLCSPAAGFITGQVLGVNGGLVT
ncbi:MAG TPA: 3-oxoacyl-ACP reductase FabG [Candidatus Anaerofilum faecale]|nr:3-oxoacyl-ACP reductase FabG [Anaerofilum sp. An201]OUP00335.1 3-oxoacyl-ACP reductase [Anaerofilum sp. An201]HIX14075.1 3-oxoacyl-ACP reductase FabG [Candidatus Anaerofilum faecale]